MTSLRDVWWGRQRKLVQVSCGAVRLELGRARAPQWPEWSVAGRAVVLITPTQGTIGRHCDNTGGGELRGWGDCPVTGPGPSHHTWTAAHNLALVPSPFQQYINTQNVHCTRLNISSFIE